MLTREEYKTYLRIKQNILQHDKSTQTGEDDLIAQTKSTSDEFESQTKDTSVSTVKISESEDDYLVVKIPLQKRKHSDSDDETPDAKKQNSRYCGEDEEYYDTLTKEEQEKINKIEDDILNINYTNIPIRFKVLESDMDLRLKAIAINKVEQLANTDPSSSEYLKTYNWIENMCKLPIGKYKKLPIEYTDGTDSITKFLDNIKTNLDTKVYGHKDAKNQIIRLLAKWIANPDAKGLIVGIEGKPGVGKTMLCNSICESLGLPFGFIQLGGLSDGSYLVGHSFTYEGSRWGRIAEILMGAGFTNPVLYFDELDKISTTRHGEEISNILIHLTDSTQNSKFHDKYFSDIEIDLSKCLIVFSYNDITMINPILKDRLITIKTDGYNHKDKIKIAQDYMLPLIYKEFGFQNDELIFSNDIIGYIINVTEEEDGVRNLKRSLEEIVSQINLYKLLKTNIFKEKILSFPLTITREIIDKFIHKKEKNISLPMMYI